MDPMWILVAYTLGMVVRQVGLPPMIGFLAAGFVLGGFGVDSSLTLERIAEAGVILLLFTIGVKLDVRDLLRREVFVTASAHMMTTTLVMGGIALLFGLIGVVVFVDLDWRTALLVGFALSFSSTVFAVKALEDSGGAGALYGRTAIGILIIQDIFAVFFLVFADGKVPEWYAIFIIPGIIVARPILMLLLTRSGHGELLILMGVLMTFGGYASFDEVGLKGDLGALAAGMLVAAHPKANELARSLLSFKDLFLVGFFLTIGLDADPTIALAGLAFVVLIAAPIKGALFVALLTLLRLKRRTAMRSGLILANYSEFGLIVASVGVKQEWISSDWLVVLAIALSLSFVTGPMLTRRCEQFLVMFERPLGKLKREEWHPDESPIELKDVRFFVAGMGRVGTGAYDALRARFGDIVVGVDFRPKQVQKSLAEGRRVILGDASDPDFIDRLKRLEQCENEWILLALPKREANLNVIRLAKEMEFPGRVAALVDFDDEKSFFHEEGADVVFTGLREAGHGFADHITEIIDEEEGAVSAQTST